jgi:hypothetical protein
MASKRRLPRKLTPRNTAAGFRGDFTDLFRSLSHAFFDSYRPELHYMRGPGPKWQAKNAAPRAAIDPGALPALVRVKAR